MIGDNLETDIKGALNAGLDAVFVNHVNAVVTFNPTYTVTHLQQLEEIFKNTNPSAQYPHPVFSGAHQYFGSHGLFVLYFE